MLLLLLLLLLTHDMAIFSLYAEAPYSLTASFTSDTNHITNLFTLKHILPFISDHLLGQLIEFVIQLGDRNYRMKAKTTWDAKRWVDVRQGGISSDNLGAGCGTAYAVALLVV